MKRTTISGHGSPFAMVTRQSNLTLTTCGLHADMCRVERTGDEAPKRLTEWVG
jgi:hypothetical protein